MRRLRIGLTLLVFASAGGSFLPVPARGQVLPSVVVRLRAETPWVGMGRPLKISVAADNQGVATLANLSIELIVMAPARSRSAYELTVTSDPTPPLLLYSFPQEGTLEPGSTRSFGLTQAMDSLQARGEDALYPIRVEVRAQDQVVGAIRTPMIFLFERPQVPLNLQWTWLLSEPLRYGPSGTFLSTGIEADLAEGGRVDAMVQALQRLGSAPADLVVSASLADQLLRMAAGYRIVEANGEVRTVEEGTGGAADAARILDALRAVARRSETELIGTPLGDPSLPALATAGLSHDLPQLQSEGRQQVALATQRTPSGTVLRPPGSHLDPLTLRTVVAQGAQMLLVDQDFIPTQKFATPPTLRLVSAGSSAVAILPEPQTAALASSVMQDPVLAAHIALGALAAAWFDLPGTPGRGTAMLFTDDGSLSPVYLEQLAGLVGRSPWLDVVPASRFTTLVPPTERRPIPRRSYRGYDPGMVGRLHGARDLLTNFEATAPGDLAMAQDLREKLLLVDSGAALADPAYGERVLRYVRDHVTAVYRAMSIEDPASKVTLASRAGAFPLTLANRSGVDATVKLRFVSDRRLEFVGGQERTITLPKGERTLTIQVRAQANGRIPIKVQLLSQSEGTPPQAIAERLLVIRSTAYNQVALLITVGAALFLFAWWARRFLPRRKA